MLTRASAPTVAIPMDRKHEFLSRPLPKNDPALASWRRHFKEKGVKTVEREGPWGIQIYLHRITITDQGSVRQIKWCCSNTISLTNEIRAKRRRACRSLKDKRERDELAQTITA